MDTCHRREKSRGKDKPEMETHVPSDWTLARVLPFLLIWSFCAHRKLIDAQEQCSWQALCSYA